MGKSLACSPRSADRKQPTACQFQQHLCLMRQILTLP